MKKIYLALCLLLTSCSVEKTTNSSTKEDYYPAIYPGCEKYPKEQLKHCLRTKITQHIYKYSDELIKYADMMNKSSIRVITHFKIDEEGRVEIISVKPSDMTKEITTVLKKLPIIKPAMINNKPQIVEFSFPVRFILEP